MDRGSWWATVHRVTKNLTQLNTQTRLGTDTPHTHTHTHQGRRIRVEIKRLQLEKNQKTVSAINIWDME